VASLRPEVGPAERRERVVALLQKVGLHADSVSRYPHEFLRRAAAADRHRGAARRVEPRLIICGRADLGARRIGAGADPQTCWRSCKRELGVAYLFITHNLASFEYLGTTSR